jgi:hypothetical protein
MRNMVVGQQEPSAKLLRSLDVDQQHPAFDTCVTAHTTGLTQAGNEDRVSARFTSPPGG